MEKFGRSMRLTIPNPTPDGLPSEGNWCRNVRFWQRAAQNRVLGSLPKTRLFESIVFVVTRYEFSRSRLDELPLRAACLRVCGTLSLVRFLDQPMRLGHFFLKLPARTDLKPQRLVSRIDILSAVEASGKRTSAETLAFDRLEIQHLDILWRVFPDPQNMRGMNKHALI